MILAYLIQQLNVFLICTLDWHLHAKSQAVLVPSPTKHIHFAEIKEEFPFFVVLKLLQKEKFVHKWCKYYLYM